MRTGTGAFSDDLGQTLDDLRSDASGFAVDLTEATRAMEGLDTSASKLSRSLSTSLKGAFDKAVFGGEKLTDVFRGLASDVAGKALDAAIMPITGAISGGIGRLVGGLTGQIGGALGFADGGAFQSGRVRAFANGGVVSAPTLFPMRGATGLMGEAGPEAILPLSRGPDGKLGVAAGGGGAGGNVTVNISTPDVAGFQRSQAQVAAQIARMVGRGQRRL